MVNKSCLTLAIVLILLVSLGLFIVGILNKEQQTDPTESSRLEANFRKPKLADQEKDALLNVSSVIQMTHIFTQFEGP